MRVEKVLCTSSVATGRVTSVGATLSKLDLAVTVDAAVCKEGLAIDENKRHTAVITVGTKTLKFDDLVVVNISDSVSPFFTRKSITLQPALVVGLNKPVVLPTGWLKLPTDAASLINQEQVKRIIDTLSNQLAQGGQTITVPAITTNFGNVFGAKNMAEFLRKVVRQFVASLGNLISIDDFDFTALETISTDALVVDILHQRGIATFDAGGSFTLREVLLNILEPFGVELWLKRTDSGLKVVAEPLIAPQGGEKKESLQLELPAALSSLSSNKQPQVVNIVAFKFTGVPISYYISCPDGGKTVEIKDTENVNWVQLYKTQCNVETLPDSAQFNVIDLDLDAVMFRAMALNLDMTEFVHMYSTLVSARQMCNLFTRSMTTPEILEASPGDIVNGYRVTSIGWTCSNAGDGGTTVSLCLYPKPSA